MWKRLRNYFLTALVIAAPVLVTIWITWSIIDWVDGIVRPLIPPQADPETYLRFTIPGTGILVAVLFLTLVGFLAANFVGRSLLRVGERLVNRVPIIRAVYGAVKQIVATALADRSKNFQLVGLIEHPRRGVWAICLISTEAKGQIAAIAGQGREKVYACVVPPSPVPTAGALLFVPESEVILLDMSVEQAIKMIVSVGLVSPDYPREPGKTPTNADKRRAAAAAGFRLHEPAALPPPASDPVNPPAAT